MDAPDDLRYTRDHEWVKIDGKIATIGITDHAQEQLGDIVYVELPEEGEKITKDDAFGSVESVKAVSDCCAPVSGDVVEVNDILADSPETINEDCYGEGWLIKVEISEKASLGDLLDHKEYIAFVEEETA